MLLSDLLSELGVPGVELRLGSLGSFEARRAYLEDLKAHLHAHEGELSKDVRERIDINPLRAFDADDEGTQGVMASAPTIVGQLEGEDAEHFEAVKALLDAAGIAYVVDPTLVRGLDYYTRTIFSFVCDALGRAVGDRRRRPLRRPDRAARRAGDAGGRVRGGDRADPAGAGRRGPGGRSRRLRRDRRPRPARAGDGAGGASCATPGSRPRSTSPAAASRASSNTPTGSAPAVSSSSRPTAAPNCATWRPASSGRPIPASFSTR